MRGVVTRHRHRASRARAVVLTVGTFSAAGSTSGLDSYPAAAPAIRRRSRWRERLRELPLRVGRLKTGTPPRIDGRTHRLLAA